MVRRTANGAGQQKGDAFLQNLVGRQPDRVPARPGQTTGGLNLTARAFAPVAKFAYNVMILILDSGCAVVKSQGHLGNAGQKRALELIAPGELRTKRGETVPLGAGKPAPLATTMRAIRPAMPPMDRGIILSEKCGVRTWNPRAARRPS